MTRARGELPELEEQLLGIERPSEEEEAEQSRLLADKRNLRTAGLKNLMAQDWFREWLWERLSSCGTFDNIHGASPNGSPDPLATQFHLGRKSAGWELWTVFDDLTPELASLMRREASRSETRS